MDVIYFDHAATTPTDPRVVAAMAPVFQADFANPSSSHGPGERARALVEHGRGQLAALLGAQPDEIYFTSGGTESDNWALKGIAAARPRTKDHCLVSAVEHHAVLHAVERLKRLGVAVELIPVDSVGRVDPREVARRIRPTTFLVSVMHANNEVGTIQPISAIGALCREKGIPFHVDAVQTVGHVPIDLSTLPVDLLSLSGHKFYGPKGVGALFIRSGVRIQPLMDGGGQEGGRRAGTLNSPGIVGLGEAAQIALAELAEAATRVAALRDRLLAGLCAAIDGVELNGCPDDRLPGNLSVRFAGIGEPLLQGQLAEAGVACSSGSACTSTIRKPSHVMVAMGLPPEASYASLRFTLGRSTTREEVDEVLFVTQRAVQDLRGSG
ncbi:MAG: cysteine desulfurase family protein [Nitrospirota bacterium]|jgi:cysteine desulfurase